jgi:uncharacterized protein YkwD
MRISILACLLLLTVDCRAAAPELYGELNRLRAGEGRCGTTRLPALSPQAALESAARSLARGDTLERAITAAGYRATRTSFFSFSGDSIDARAEQLLATRADCRALMDAAMTDVGIFVDARELRVVLAAPFAPAVRMSEDAAGHRVLELINEARASSRVCGTRKFNAARPLRWNDKLADASRTHAEDMARGNYFSHTGRDGSTPAQRVERSGYRYRSMGENIAAGQMAPEAAVAGWIKSPPHCANLMNGVFTEMGAAYAVNPKSEMGVYWAQEFGAPR